MSKIAGKIKALRLEQGLTQEDFAHKIKISRSNLAQIETGKTNPTFEAIAMICSVFGVDANIFVNDNNFVSEWVHKKDKFIHTYINNTEDALNNFANDYLNSEKGEILPVLTEIELLNKIQQNASKIGLLYQRLIDVRILIYQELKIKGSMFATKKEMELLQDFAKPGDYIYNNETMFGYKYESLDYKGKLRFMGQQNACIDHFTDTFFDLFRQLFKGIKQPYTADERKAFLTKRAKDTGNWSYSHMIDVN